MRLKILTLFVNLSASFVGIGIGLALGIYFPKNKLIYVIVNLLRGVK